MTAGRRLLLLALAAALLAAPAARAHDFWVQPAPYAAAAGETIGLRLFIGDAFDGMPFLYDPDHAERFFVLAPDGRSAVAGTRNRLNVASIEATAPGAYVIGYESAWTLLALPADRFDAYLRKEGFERVREARAARGESAAPGREAYARSAKAIVHAGGGRAGYDAVLGLPLELVPERAPADLAPGGTFVVRLLRGGAPLAGARILAFADADRFRPVEAETGADGRAALVLPHAGAWLVRAVHMTGATPGRDADWESMWASLTFAIPRPAGE